MIPEMLEKLHGLRGEAANYWMKKQEIYGVGNWRVHAAKLPMATVLFIPEETLGKPEITYKLDGAEAVCKFPGYDQSFRFHTHNDYPESFACDSSFFMFNERGRPYLSNTHESTVTRTPSRATDTQGLFMFTFTQSKAREGKVVCGQLLDDELTNGLIRVWGLPFPKKEVTFLNRLADLVISTDVMKSTYDATIDRAYGPGGKEIDPYFHMYYVDPFGMPKDLLDAESKK